VAATLAVDFGLGLFSFLAGDCQRFNRIVQPPPGRTARGRSSEPVDASGPARSHSSARQVEFSLFRCHVEKSEVRTIADKPRSHFTRCPSSERSASRSSYSMITTTASPSFDQDYCESPRLRVNLRRTNSCARLAPMRALVLMAKFVNTIPAPRFDSG